MTRRLPPVAAKPLALAKRELIEHRNGLLMTPAVLMGLMFLLIIGVLGFGLGGVNIVIGSPVGDARVLPEMLAGLDPEARAGRIVGLLVAVVAPALVVLPLVIFFVLLGGLYEERRDRSFLFWKSMPVSDHGEVLAKFAGGVLLAPGLVFALTVVFQLLTLVSLSVIGGIQGAPVITLWDLSTLFGHWAYLILAMLVWALWAAPVFAWVLFCSAYAPRMPFMYAVVPPVVIAVVEALLFDTELLGEWIGRHLAGLPMLREIAAGPSFVEAQMGNSFDAALQELLASPDFTALFASLTRGDFWLGLTIAAVLLYGATWLRRYNL